MHSPPPPPTVALPHSRKPISTSMSDQLHSLASPSQAFTAKTLFATSTDLNRPHAPNTRFELDSFFERTISLWKRFPRRRSPHPNTAILISTCLWSTVIYFKYLQRFLYALTTICVLPPPRTLHSQPFYVESPSFSIPNSS